MENEDGAGSLDMRAVDTLRQSVGGDSEFLDELIQTFLDESPGQAAELRTAVAGGDAQTARRVAHTLKSNAATFGIVGLIDPSRAIEERAAEGSLDGLDDLLHAVDSALADAKPALLALAAGDAA